MQENTMVTGRPYLRLVNPKLEDLEGLIWEPWQDLALVLCVRGKTDHGTFHINIPEDARGLEKIDIENMMENARETLAELAEINGMREMVGKLTGDISEEDITDLGLTDIMDWFEDTGEEMLTVTTADGVNGASAITLPEVQQELQRRLGDYYIIPSSKHEVLCFSAQDVEPSGLNNMIMQVNIAEVETKDWLGDHAYICKNGVISSVERGEGS